MEEKIQELYFHLKTLKSALNTLEEVLEKPFSLIVRNATIQRFEYTFELALPFTHKLALPTIVTFECEAVTHQL
ncbi:MAG: nucleotidyltransferase substrate binding protein [Deltaproteobacteria bacterium]|jgi:hypothetical protein|nr:nucleotidyltransferase substrate binding protein [Deltaproteobacteria bacterium]MDL1989173.1 nucleotidyltransferase substrate binding protein [Deltaproteobacteria bacterium]